MEEKKWRIYLTEHQLMLMAMCVEDCHRFAAGQTELDNTILHLKDSRNLRKKLQDLKPLIGGDEYDWAGNECTREPQKRFIAETYYLYREIYHQLTLDEARTEILFGNVYLSDTLRCKDSGEPIKVERIE